MADPLSISHAAIAYRVQAPDGTVVEFSGPPDMTDDQKILRAQQEYKFKTGAIPTTERGGQIQSVGDTLANNSDAIGTAIGLGGVVSGLPPVVAAAPAMGRAIKAGGQYISGRKIDVPSPAEMGVLAAEGALAGYGPVLGEKFAASTVAHPSSITGNYVKGATGSGVMPWAVRTAGEAAHAAANSPLARSAAYLVPDQIRQYIMDRLNGQ